MEASFGHEHIAHFEEMLGLDHRSCYQHMGLATVRGIRTDWWVCGFGAVGHENMAPRLKAAGVQSLELYFSEARWAMKNDMERRVPIRAVVHGLAPDTGRSFTRTFDFIGFDHDQSEKSDWKAFFTPPYQQCQVETVMPTWPSTHDGKKKQ